MKSQFNSESAYVRVMLIGIDQTISATSNFLVVWLCLTSLQTETFGSFSYSWTTIALFVVLSRALFGIPALLDSESYDPAQIGNTSASLTGTLILGAITAFVTLSLHLLGGTSDSEIWIAGLFLLAPLILFQDQVRYLIVATKKITFAIVLDLVVLCCILVTVVASKMFEFVGWHLILGLAIGYLMASSLFVIYNPIKFSLTNMRNFIGIDFHRRSRLVSDAFLAWGFGIVSITLIRVATGDSGVAAYNGLVFLFGPVSLVTVFLIIGLQSEIVRTIGSLATRHKASLVLVSFSPIFWILLILYLPELFLEKLLGQSTQIILANSIPFGIAASLGIGAEVLNLFMRAHKKFTQIAVIRFIVGMVLISCISVGFYSGIGLNQIIWTLAVTNSLAVILTAVLLQKGRTHHKP